MLEKYKSTINLLLPLFIGIWAGSFAYRKYNGNEKKVAIYSIGSFVIAWLIVRTITNKAVEEQNRPDQVKYKLGGGYTTGSGGVIGGGNYFDPTPLTDALFNDIDGLRTTTNDALYSQLASLGDVELIEVYDDWNQRYYQEDNETMIAAMQGESYGWGWFNDTPQDVDNIIKRLQRLGAN